MKKVSVRIESIELRVLEILGKQGHKPSSIIRRALSQYLHANHEPVYQEIHSQNRRRNEELLKSYYARQQAQTSTE